MYQRIFNAPSYSFLVQVSSPVSGHVEYQRIDQYVRPPLHGRDVTRAYNNVQTHLNELSKRSGLSYHIIAEGYILDVDRIIKRSNIRVS